MIQSKHLHEASKESPDLLNCLLGERWCMLKNAPPPLVGGLTLFSFSARIRGIRPPNHTRHPKGVFGGAAVGDRYTPSQFSMGHEIQRSPTPIDPLVANRTEA